MAWCYLHDVAQRSAPSTLWMKYSMLKLCFKVKKNIDFGKCFKVTAYVKNQMPVNSNNN